MMIIRKISTMKCMLLLLTSACVGRCLPPPHPAVLAVRNEEEFLPEYQRSPARHNPHLQELLLLTSLLHGGEMVVRDREADNISRNKVYSLLTHAGFVPRRGVKQNAAHHFYQKTSNSHQILSQNLHDALLLPAPEILQYL